MKNKIVFGNRIKDLVTGFEGICTAEVRYMNGCEKWQIDGKVVNGNVESLWIDKQQVDFVDSGLAKESESVLLKETGGPSTAPTVRESRP